MYMSRNVVIWVLKEGGGCGLARFLVALDGGGFAVARMSADDRGSMGIGVEGDGDRRLTAEEWLNFGVP